jgi:hypothetical protein
VEDRQAGSALFPLVLQVQGGASPDGGSLLVEAATVEGEMLRFAVALTDVQHFVAFLLVSAGKMTAAQGLHAGSPPRRCDEPSHSRHRDRRRRTRGKRGISRNFRRPGRARVFGPDVGIRSARPHHADAQRAIQAAMRTRIARLRRSPDCATDTPSIDGLAGRR